MRPETSPESTIGAVVQTFRTSRVNLVAGGFLGLILLVGGVVLIARAPLLFPQGVTLGYVLGAACITGGLAFLTFTLRIAYARVDLCEAGFRHYSLAGIDEVTWDEVDLIQLHVAAQDGAYVDPSISVLTERGKTYHFTANHVTQMTTFMTTVKALTGGYDNLWEVTSQASKRRYAAFMVFAGVFLMVIAPLMFMDIARAERNAGARPVKVPALIFILYEVGGKWLAAGGLFLIGLACLGWGLVALSRENVSTPTGRKTKRIEHTEQT